MPKMPGPPRTQSKRRYTPDTLPGFTCKRCDDCGRRVVSRPDQQRHANLHLPPEYDDIKYPHACDWPKCTQRFSQATALHDHINVHTGARPYKCPECSKGFANAGNLHHHRGRVHQYKSDKTRGRRKSPRAAPYTKRRKAARTASPSLSDRSEDVHDSQDSPLPADAPTTASGSATTYAPEISPAASFSSSFAGPSSQPSPADAVFLWTNDNNHACVPVAGPSRFNAPSPAETSYACDASLPVGTSYPFFGQDFIDFSDIPAQQSDDGLMFTPPQRSFNLSLDDPTLPLDRSNLPFDTSSISLDSTFPIDTPAFSLDAFGVPANSFGFDSSLYPLNAPLPPLNDPFFPLEAHAPGSYIGQTTYNGQILFDGHSFGSFNDRTPYTTSLPQPPANFAHDSLEEDARHTFARLRFTHP